MSDKGFLHRRSNNFGKVPYDLMTDTAISAGAVRLYAYMHWRYGANQDNHEGRDSMAKAIGVSKRTITKYVQELEQSDWVVIVPRKNKSGTATNFYHVFELQEDCIAWRKDKKRPKPTRELTERKGRKGIGGKPSHNNVNSSSLSKQESDNVNSSSPTPLNSSSHNPDSYDPEKYIAATKNAAKNATSEHQLLFEAICNAFGYDWRNMTDVKKANIGRVARELRKSGATPGDIPDLYRWCKKKDWSDFTENVFATRWDDYKSERKKRGLDAPPLTKEERQQQLDAQFAPLPLEKVG